MAKKRHNFEVITSKLAYSNPFMQIVKHEVMRPDGLVKPYWVLERGGDFSIIVPLFPDMTTELVGQYRVPIKKFSWEFPMGMVAGANPLVTAKQELREETGLHAKQWKKLGYFHVAPGFSSQRAHIFLAQNLTVGESEPEEDEYLETKRIPMKKLQEMILKGIVADGPTIVAFQFLKQKGII